MAAAKQTNDAGGSNPAGQSHIGSFFDSSCFFLLHGKFSSAFIAAASFGVDQATKCLSGGAPYRFEFNLTTVNVLVLCSTIVAFLNQMRYAFFPERADACVMTMIL